MGDIYTNPPQSRNEELVRAIIDGTEYTDPPQSRNEAILKSIIDGTEYTAAPQSRMEDLLLQLKEKYSNLEVVPIELEEDGITLEIPFIGTGNISSIICICDEQGTDQRYAFHDWTALYLYGQEKYATMTTRNGYNYTPFYNGVDQIDITVDNEDKTITATINVSDYTFMSDFKYTAYIFFENETTAANNSKMASDEDFREEVTEPEKIEKK